MDRGEREREKERKKRKGKKNLPHRCWHCLPPSDSVDPFLRQSGGRGAPVAPRGQGAGPGGDGDAGERGPQGGDGEGRRRRRKRRRRRRRRKQRRRRRRRCWRSRARIRARRGFCAAGCPRSDVEVDSRLRLGHREGRKEVRGRRAGRCRKEKEKSDFSSSSSSSLFSVFFSSRLSRAIEKNPFCSLSLSLLPSPSLHPSSEATTSTSRSLVLSALNLSQQQAATMRASTAARFSSFNGLAKSSTVTMPSPSSVRTLAAAPLSFASSTGRSLLSTSASASAAAKAGAVTKRTAPGRRGSVAVARSAPGGDAAAFLRSEGLSDAALRAIEAKHPDAMKAGVDTVRAR